MSIFTKIKQGLGIGTLKVELQVPGQVDKTSGTLQGQAVLSAKSDQQVKSIELKLVEKYSTGRGEEQKTREFELGKLALNDAFAIKQDETKTIPFTLSFTFLRSSNQSLAEEKGALGALGKAAVFARNERSEFEVRAEVKLEGTVLNPSATEPIQLV